MCADPELGESSTACTWKGLLPGKQRVQLRTSGCMLDQGAAMRFSAAGDMHSLLT